MHERYFDNAASTPVAPEVVEAMMPWFSECPGNAHSIHSLGLSAREAVEEARAHVARLIGAEDPVQVVFTSGATEANNWVISHFGKGQVSPFEHNSVKEPACKLGFTTSDSPAEGGFLSHMLVNNETGVLFDLSEVRGSAEFLHSDVTQAVGKIPLSLDGIDSASLSSHKFYGPKGVGALYLRDPFCMRALIQGGGQEQGRRSGTLNVTGIVGMGAAAKLAMERQPADFEKATRLRELFLGSLKSEYYLHERGGKYSPFVVALNFWEVEGETLLIDLDRKGFAVSAGSACSSRSSEPSHVLRAIGAPEEEIRGTIRVSFGRSNTEASVIELAEAIEASLAKLRMLRV